MFSKIKHISDLRTQANQIKKALASESVTGSGAWGKVEMTMNGNQEVLSVMVAQDMLTDKAKLEAAVKDATNDAIKKVQRVMAQKMQAMGGLDLPKMS